MCGIYIILLQALPWSFAHGRCGPRAHHLGPIEAGFYGLDLLWMIGKEPEHIIVVVFFGDQLPRSSAFWRQPCASCHSWA